jgi:anti-sigma28 factor (negative regulator of flagellin synthesis)
MMTTDIVNEVARLMAQRDLGLKDPKEARELKAKRALPEMRDAVELSKSAREYAVQDPAAGYESDQNLKVERLKSLVGGGNYRMDHAMVETIAERIANMLV